MFVSFFPAPRLFFGSALLWTGICVVFWLLVVSDLGPSLSFGWLLGLGFPGVELPADAAPAQAAAHQALIDDAHNAWRFQYIVVVSVIFYAFWSWFTPHRWLLWSTGGSILILVGTWYLVQLDVEINEWFGDFYNAIQQALSEPNSITLGEYFALLLTFGKIAGIYIILSVFLDFFTKHFVFRWRTAMNDYFMSNWGQLRHIEGASQRVQEDTRLFAEIVESLGSFLLRNLLTLFAFFPILLELSANVTELPWIGPVDASLIYVALISALVGTVGLALLGYRLPGLEFNNQMVEAAYRKELVYGEDHADRADPPSVQALFGNVRRNYFRLFFHYMYFDVGRYSYLQASTLVPYIALGPTIVSGVITLGIMQQIVRAFGRVENAFQFLVNSWTTIVKLISVYKRLRQFEAQLGRDADADLGPGPITAGTPGA